MLLEWRLFLTAVFSINGHRLDPQERIFPYMMDLNAPGKFSFKKCKFRVQRSKFSTGRVVGWREHDILNSFTMEATFAGGNFGPGPSIQFTPQDFESIGAHFCDTLLDYCDPDQSKAEYLMLTIRAKVREKLEAKLGYRAPANMNIDRFEFESDLESSTAGSDSAPSEDEAKQVASPGEAADASSYGTAPASLCHWCRSCNRMPRTLIIPGLALGRFLAAAVSRSKRKTKKASSAKSGASTAPARQRISVSINNMTDSSDRSNPSSDLSASNSPSFLRRPTFRDGPGSARGGAEERAATSAREGRLLRPLPDRTPVYRLAGPGTMEEPETIVESAAASLAAAARSPRARSAVSGRVAQRPAEVPPLHNYPAPASVPQGRATSHRTIRSLLGEPERPAGSAQDQRNATPRTLSTVSLGADLDFGASPTQRKNRVPPPVRRF